MFNLSACLTSDVVSAFSVLCYMQVLFGRSPLVTYAKNRDIRPNMEGLTNIEEKMLNILKAKSNFTLFNSELKKITNTRSDFKQMGHCH